MRITVKLRKNLLREIRLHDRAISPDHVCCIHARPFQGSRKQAPAIYIHIDYGHEHRPDLEMVSEMTIEYMRQISLQDQPFFSWWYRSHKHDGIHIVASSIHDDEAATIAWTSKLNEREDIVHRLEEKFIVKPSDLLTTPLKHPRMNLNFCIKYGKTPLHTTFNSIISTVVDSYYFKTLEGLKKVLNLYDITFSLRDEKNKSGGNTLQYSRLQDNSEITPISINESELICEASLKYIENRRRNIKDFAEVFRLVHQIKNIFSFTPLTLADFQEKMFTANIIVYFEKSETDLSEKIWFIYLSERHVAEGAELGDGNYTAAAIRDRCVPEGSYSQEDRLRYLDTWSHPPEKVKKEKVSLRPDHEIFR